MNKNNLSDEEINAILKKNNKTNIKGRIWNILGFITLAYFIYVIFTADGYMNTGELNGYEIMLTCVYILFFCLGIHFTCEADSSAKENAAVPIILTILKEAFENVKYDPQKFLEVKLLQKANIFKFDEVSGSDYVQATYKGVNIKMSDIEISSATDVAFSKGNLAGSEELHFSGLWIVCDFHKKLSTELTLFERRGIGKLFTFGSTQTEYSDFNKKFYISTQNQHEAFYILTPHMMEYIIKMDKKADGDTYMSFLQEGKVHIAINSGMNAFELANLSTNANELRERFRNEILYVTDLIDELHLVDTFFAKNVNNKKKSK